MDEQKKVRKLLAEAYEAGYRDATLAFERARLEKNTRILDHARAFKNTTIGMEDSGGGVAHYKFVLVGYTADIS